VRAWVRIGAVIAPILLAEAPYAHPDGAPWGAARPSAAENCATCHFDSEAIQDSSLLRVDGLPETPVARETYELTIFFYDPDAVTAGFQLIAQAEGDRAGNFVSQASDVEFIGAAIRSTAALKNDQKVNWIIQWQTPAMLSLPIFFYVAATAANNDGSPLGDRIHFRSYRLGTNDQ
jgi:hypothetical protein